MHGKELNSENFLENYIFDNVPERLPALNAIKGHKIFWKTKKINMFRRFFSSCKRLL